MPIQLGPQRRVVATLWKPECILGDFCSAPLFLSFLYSTLSKYMEIYVITHVVLD